MGNWITLPSPGGLKHSYDTIRKEPWNILIEDRTNILLESYIIKIMVV
jgi:hypothetical protein